VYNVGGIAGVVVGAEFVDIGATVGIGEVVEGDEVVARVSLHLGPEHAVVDVALVVNEIGESE